MSKIESAYLNADDEQKANNVLSLAKEMHLTVNWGKIQIPKGYGSMRALFEVKSVASVIASYLEIFPNEEKARIIDEFDEVFQKELDQVDSGTQEFVAEKDEANQV